MKIREHKDLSASARDDAGSDIDLLDAFVFWNTYVGEDGDSCYYSVLVSR